MTTKIPRPKLEVKTFSDVKKRYNVDHLNKKFPCLRCRGVGKIHYPEDYDTIEGYKGVKKKPCNTCNGSGEVEKKVYSDVLREYKVKYHEKLLKYNIVKNILDPLSESEIQLLKSYFMWKQIL